MRLIAALAALLFVSGCFEGPMGPAGKDGQDAVVNSYATEISVPSDPYPIQLPSWTAGDGVLITADAWLYRNGWGWAPINIIWNDGVENYQATMKINAPTVTLMWCQGLNVRVRAWQLAE